MYRVPKKSRKKSQRGFIENGKQRYAPGVPTLILIEKSANEKEWHKKKELVLNKFFRSID